MSEMLSGRTEADMWKMRRAVLIAAWGLGWSAAVGQDPPKIEIESEYGFHSNYVWRGLEIDRRTNFQMSHTLRRGSFSINVWSLARSAWRTFENADELDYEVRWDTELGRVALSPFVNVFTYPRDSQADGTTEIGLNASFEVGDVSYFLDQYLDVEDSSGAFFGEFGAEYEKELSDHWSLGGFASIGWGNRRFHLSNFDVDKAAATMISAGLFADLVLGEGIVLMPSVTYQQLLHRDLRDAVSRPSNWTWSMTLAIRR